jgi:hypothetical protein
MNAAELQTILSTVLRQQEERNAEALRGQEQRFVQLLDTLRVGLSIQNGAPNAAAAMLAGETKDVPTTRLPAIEAFMADKEDTSHFEDWLKRFEMSVQCTAPNINDKEKAMVLATKLSTEAFAEFRKCCLPKEVTDYTYEETVTKLRLLFTKQRSIFADRYDCLRLTRLEGEEFIQLVNRCKAAIKRFQFESLTGEQFSALILLSALKAPIDEPLRARILQKLSTDADQVRFDDIVTECVNFLSTKADCQLFSQEQVQLNAMQKPPHKSQHRQLHKAGQNTQETATFPHLHATDVAVYTGTNIVLIRSISVTDAGAPDIWNSSATTSEHPSLTAFTRSRRIAR